jgi:protein-tyrosine phosphatase
LNWISTTWLGRLAVAARPRGGDWLEDDLKSWHEAGATVILSLLELHENTDLGLEDEPAAAARAGLAYICFPIEDRSVPTSREAMRALLDEMETLLKEGADVLVHCRQGIGRSGLVAIALLIRAGKSVDEAIEIASAARGLPVPETPAQLAWVRSFSPPASSSLAIDTNVCREPHRS